MNYIVNMEHVMFAIALVHQSGGTKTVMGKTRIECMNGAAFVKSREYVFGTIPYAIFKVEDTQNTYDCTVPWHIKKELGMEMRFLIQENE